MAQIASTRHSIAKGIWLRSISALLIICTLVLGRSSDSNSLEHTGDHELVTLLQMCQDFGSQRSGLPILKLSQVSHLISADQEHRIEVACDAKYFPAIRELRALLAPERLQDICSIEMYELIRAYHSRFIHYYLPELTRKQLLEKRHLFKRNVAPIPAPLRNFFILFAKEINASCKQHLVATVNDKLNPIDEDFLVLEKFRHEVHQLSNQLRSLSKLGLNSFEANHKTAGKFNKLQIIDLIDPHRNESDPRASMKLHVILNFDGPLSRIKLACDRHLIPVYMELFAPVIKLNNLGYIERTWSKLEDKKLNEDESLLRWHEIIRVCEAFKNIEVEYDSVQEPTFRLILNKSSLNLDEDLYSKRERLSNRIEIVNMKEVLHESAEEVSRVQHGYDSQPQQPPHDPVAFMCHTCLSEMQDIELELNYFRKDISRFVWRRTSRMTGVREKIRQRLRVLSFTIKELSKPNSSTKRSLLNPQTTGDKVKFVTGMVITIAAISVILILLFG